MIDCCLFLLYYFNTFGSFIGDGDGNGSGDGNGGGDGDGQNNNKGNFFFIVHFECIIMHCCFFMMD